METAILNGLIAVGAGLAILGGAMGAGMGQGNAVRGALEAQARNPELRKELQTTMFIGLGIIESAPIYGLLVAFTLIAKMK
ncbi:MAG: ATP synthase F0 subunit C [Mycoplasmatales bacterium]